MLFDYKCNKCGEFCEISKSIKDPHPTKCPKCHEEALERTFVSAPTVSYVGKGWMKTDGKY
jgi:putative FmdB family regulatory protein